MQYELKSRQVCLFFIAFMPLTKLFMLPSVLAGINGEDMWISTVINVLIDFVTLFILTISARRAKTNFYGLLENSFGKIGSKVILSFYLLYFILKAVLPLNEQKDYVEYTLYTLMPTSYYFLPFFIAAFYICVKNLRVIGRASDIMWIITAVGIIVLFSLSISNADFGALLPVGAKGLANTVKGSYFSLAWFGDSVYLVFFIGEFVCNKKDCLKIMLSYAVGAFIVIAFMIIFYCIFTSIAHRQRFALTEISKYTTVINNIGRFDYLGILFLLLSNIFSLSLPLFFACKILNYVCGFSKKWISPLIVVGIQLIISIFLQQYFYSIENLIINYGGIFFFIIGNVLPCLTLILTKKENSYANTQS